MRFSSNEPKTKIMENPLIIDDAATYLEPGLCREEGEGRSRMQPVPDRPSFLLPLPFSLGLGASQHPVLPVSEL